jgi:hypothetical protein
MANSFDRRKKGGKLNIEFGQEKNGGKQQRNRFKTEEEAFWFPSLFAL